MKVAESKNTATVSRSNDPFFQKGETSFFSQEPAPQNFFTKKINKPSPSIQTKLTIGEPNDPYEKEADAMADKVVQRLSEPSVQMKSFSPVDTITPFIQRKCAECEKEEELKKERKEDDISNDKIRRKPIFESNEESMPEEKNGQRINVKQQTTLNGKLQAKTDDNNAQPVNGNNIIAASLNTSSENVPALQTKCASCEQEEKLKKKEEEETELPENELQKKPIFESNEEPPGDGEENIQRKCAECEKDEKLQKRSDPSSQQTASPGIEASLNSSKGSGSALPENTREQMESSFGADFSGVRVHNDSSAMQMSKYLNAQAFTHGSDIYFNSGKYDHQSKDGKHLLVHELTHVVQQNGTNGQINRKPAKPKKPTAADSPGLRLTLSVNGSPCACLIVIHNDERNARKIAEQMSQHCSYNLTLLEPDSHSREIKIPSQSGTFDPNSLFSPDIAKQCSDDEQSCKDFLTAKSGSADPAEIKRFTQIQFFLTISQCSQSFSLPVVALHNNDIEDTEGYRDKKDKVGVSDLKTDVDKTGTEVKEGQTTLAQLKGLLKTKFGEPVKRSLTEQKGKTNIFRWCASPDISKCHIGDPDHPDNTIWVANEKDYDVLSKKDINVALQSDLAQSKGSESEGDLSTLFLILKGLIGDRFEQLIQRLMSEIATDAKDILAISLELEKLEDLTDNVLFKMNLIGKYLFDLVDILAKIAATTKAGEERDEALSKLRYINIEGPGKELSSQTGAERIRNYESIVEALKALGLHCCGDNPTKVETEIKQGLVQKKVDTNSPQNVSLDNQASLSSSKGSGSPLPQNTKEEMESSFGEDFSAVRIHNDSSAAQMNTELSAQAFTNGSDIYFNSGKYDTGSKGGKLLLAHELAHVIQQGGAPVNSHSVIGNAPQVQMQGGSTGRLPALSPDELLQFLLSQRGFGTSKPGIPTFDPKGIGKPTGKGYQTYAAVQIVDKEGKQVKVSTGAYLSGGDQHGEVDAINNLRNSLPEGAKFEGGKMIVAVEQVPCPNCDSSIRAYAKELGVSEFQVYVPQRESIRSPGTFVKPKTAATGAFQGGRGPTTASLFTSETLETSSAASSALTAEAKAAAKEAATELKAELKMLRIASFVTTSLTIISGVLDILNAIDFFNMAENKLNGGAFILTDYMNKANEISAKADVLDSEYPNVSDRLTEMQPKLIKSIGDISGRGELLLEVLDFKIILQQMQTGLDARIKSIGGVIKEADAKHAAAIKILEDPVASGAIAAATFGDTELARLFAVSEDLQHISGTLSGALEKFKKIKESLDGDVEFLQAWYDYFLTTCNGDPTCKATTNQGWYQIIVVSAQLPDSLFDTPDGYVSFPKNGLRTSVKDDSTSPVWNEAVGHWRIDRLEENIKIDVYDYDPVTSDDLLASFDVNLKPNNPEGQSFTLTDSEVTLNLRVERDPTFKTESE
jgi:hypothetical protein